MDDQETPHPRKTGPGSLCWCWFPKTDQQSAWHLATTLAFRPDICAFSVVDDDGNVRTVPSYWVKFCPEKPEANPQ